MKSKISFFILFFSLSFILFSYAHPPVKIKIKMVFNPGNNIFKIGILHPVKNSKKHFISKLFIFLNGKKIIEQKLKNQYTIRDQRLTYCIPEATAGDIVSVEAYCSRSGKLIKKVRVKQR